MSPGRAETPVDPLLEWYDRNGRHDLPWREPERSAFELLIAEILLQKTRATAVSGAYVPLIARYPTPEAVVAAPMNEIEDRISSLGLSKRAGYIRRCSAKLLAQHSGKVPRNRSDLLEIHGVGQYTARSVLIHTGGEAIAAVDTNVERLVSRHFGIDPDDRDIQKIADDLAPRNRSSDFLHGMLDFATEVCTPRSPRCGDCPLKSDCASASDFSDGSSSE